MWVDHLLRRYGIIMLIVTFPGLALPVVAIAGHGGDMTAATMIVVALGLTGAVVLYGALAYFTFRAFRR